MKNIILLGLLYCFAGCAKDPGFEYSVPPELEPILDSFRIEAANRGYEVKLDNLKIIYDDLLTLPNCGQSNVISTSNDVQKIIRLSKDAACWDCPIELEALIFHELGHCVLGRGHDNGKLPNGDPRSIMIPDNNKIYTTCGYPIGGTVTVYYFKRSYYLDELFNPNTPVPAWGK